MGVKREENFVVFETSRHTPEELEKSEVLTTQQLQISGVEFECGRSKREGRVRVERGLKMYNFGKSFS